MSQEARNHKHHEPVYNFRVVRHIFIIRIYFLYCCIAGLNYRVLFESVIRACGRGCPRCLTRKIYIGRVALKEHFAVVRRDRARV